MEARTKFFENAVIATDGVTLVSDDLYAFEQSAWGYTVIEGVDTGSGTYDVDVSFDGGTTWLAAAADTTGVTTVMAPRVRVSATGSGGTLTVHALQKELAQPDATRTFTTIESLAAAGTTAGVQVNNPAKAFVIITGGDEADATTPTVQLETSMDGTTTTALGSTTSVTNATAGAFDLSADLDETVGRYLHVTVVGAGTYDPEWTVHLLTVEAI